MPNGVEATTEGEVNIEGGGEVCCPWVAREGGLGGDRKTSGLEFSLSLETLLTGEMGRQPKSMSSSSRRLGRRTDRCCRERDYFIKDT